MSTRLSGGWIFLIHNVKINPQFPITCQVTLSPIEKLLLDSDKITRDELEDVYREAIERGDFRLWKAIP